MGTRTTRVTTWLSTILLVPAGCQAPPAAPSADERRSAPESPPAAQAEAATATLVATPLQIFSTLKRRLSYVAYFHVERIEAGEWSGRLVCVELDHDRIGRRLLDDLGIDRVTGPDGWHARGTERPLRITVRPCELRLVGLEGMVANAEMVSWKRP